MGKSKKGSAVKKESAKKVMPKNADSVVWKEVAMEEDDFIEVDDDEPIFMCENCKDKNVKFMDTTCSKCGAIFTESSGKLWEKSDDEDKCERKPFLHTPGSREMRNAATHVTMTRLIDFLEDLIDENRNGDLKPEEALEIAAWAAVNAVVRDLKIDVYNMKYAMSNALDRLDKDNSTCFGAG